VRLTQNKILKEVWECSSVVALARACARPCATKKKKKERKEKKRICSISASFLPSLILTGPSSESIWFLHSSNYQPAL
jgi:hypothetical protein